MREIVIKGLSVLLIFFAMRQADAANTIVVAVIDTGFTKTQDNVKLCSIGRMDFTKSGTLTDSHPQRHGSNVIGLITQNAGDSGYCIVSIKVFNYVDGKLTFNYLEYLEALRFIVKLKPAILNLSMAGEVLFTGEAALIKTILDQGTQIVAAAGNDGVNLDYTGCNVYPACIDPRIYMIGNSTSNTSNTGHYIDTTEDGSNKKAAGTVLTGTSQATAIFTGKVVKQALNLRAKK
jgi:hypothetical protein